MTKEARSSERVNRAIATREAYESHDRANCEACVRTVYNVTALPCSTARSLWLEHVETLSALKAKFEVQAFEEWLQAYRKQS